MKGALPPADPGALLSLEEADVGLRPHLLYAPFDALPAPQQRTEINQQGGERPGSDSGEVEPPKALVDRRLQRAIDAHAPGCEQRNGEEPQPPAGGDPSKCQSQRGSVPFEGQRQQRRQRRRRLVHGLEQTASENSGIDDRPPRQQQRGGEIAVDAAKPFCLSKKVEAKRVLCIHERFCLTVTLLLIAVGAHCVTAEMPNNSSGAEADDIAGVLKAPAYIDVIAGRAIDRIEAAELQ